MNSSIVTSITIVSSKYGLLSNKILPIEVRAGRQVGQPSGYRVSPPQPAQRQQATAYLVSYPYLVSIEKATKESPQTSIKVSDESHDYLLSSSDIAGSSSRYGDMADSLGYRQVSKVAGRQVVEVAKPAEPGLTHWYRQTQRGSTQRGSNEEGSAAIVAAAKQSIGRLLRFFGRIRELAVSYPIGVPKPTPHPMPVGGMGGRPGISCDVVESRKFYDRKDELV
jgi:hypothetical protein